jgi:hypothetical protein
MRSIFFAAIFTFRRFRSKYNKENAISPIIPTVGPILIRYNSSKMAAMRATMLSSNNNKWVGKKGENRIIMANTIK